MKIESPISAVLGCMIIVFLLFIVEGTLMDRQVPSTFTDKIQTLSDFTYKLESGERGRIRLPHSFNNLSPRTPVTLYTEVFAQPGDYLLVKTVYTPLRLYADDQLIYTCGQEGSYPKFLLDPPTNIMTVPLPEKNGPQKLRLEYLSPTQRTTLTCSTIRVGKEVTLLVRLFTENVFLLLLALIQVFMGLVMIVITLTILRKNLTNMPFFWLGLFSLSAGLWSLGECDLTAFFIPYPSLLYIMAFTGLFIIIIPLLRFGLLVLNLHHKRPLQVMMLLLMIAVTGALGLQLAGWMGVSRSLYLFHVIIPLAFIIFAFCIVWDYVRYRNPRARHFILPMLVLAVSAVLELINYQLHFTNILSLFMQMGIWFFILSLGIMGGYYTKEALLTNEEKKRINLELSMMEWQLDVQKKQYALLTKNAEAVKAQRHDLRHQLAVIKYYNDSGDQEGLDQYIGELVAKIPVDKELFLCENAAVNAVALYYLSIGESQGIQVSIMLTIPTDCGRIQDSDLCIIIGNFLENGIEACQKMTTGQKYIKMYSRSQYGVLTVAMDNSFDGVFEQRDGIFLSRKHNDKGTGLMSVETVAERYDGSAKFEIRDNVFRSSVYVKM